MKTSAGLLMYRRRAGALEVLLAHPGGPYWSRRDAGVWSIPKGLIEPGEEALAAARREFFEETGVRPEGPFLELPTIRQKAGKIVHAWAFEGGCDPSKIRSNTFRMEWPPRSGIFIEVPEVDRVDWFTPEHARVAMNPAQVALIDVLLERLDT